MLSKDDVYKAIDKTKVEKDQALAGYLLSLQKQIQHAINSWYYEHQEESNTPLSRITQIAATAIACLEQYGTTGNVIATPDIAVTVKEVHERF